MEEQINKDIIEFKSLKNNEGKDQEKVFYLSPIHK